MSVKERTVEQYESLIGKKVVKTSPKPFKSGSKVNTVKSIVEHPYQKRPHLLFWKMSR